MSKRNRILLGLAVALAALLAVLLWQSERESKAKQAYITAYTARLTPLLNQRNRLQQQLDDLERAYTAEAGGTGTLTLVCLTADEQAYTELYPALQARGFAAALVLWPDALPGTPGCVSMDDYAQLRAAGWQPCLAWDGETDLDAWLSPVQAWCDENGLAMPQAVYLPPTRYAADLDAALLAHGFTAVLHHGEDDLALITQTTADLWQVGVAGWNTTGASDRGAALAAAGGATAFAIGFDTADEGTLYEPEQFARMLNKLTTWQQNAGLLVTDLTEAQATRAAANAAQTALRTAYEAQKQSLEQQLAALAPQIAEVEATWEWEG